MFNRVYLVGVGLINGSLAKDLHHRQLAKTIIGVGRNSHRLSQAQALGIIDEYQLLQECNVADADLVVLGVPVGKTGDSLALLKPSLVADTLLTDVGSTKSNVMEAAAGALGELPAKFVPGHPIAGSEQSGFEHAQVSLFEGRRVILTPTAKTDITAVQSIKSMWQAMGAVVDEMSAQHHDQILAATSHVPHIVAYALVNYLSSKSDADNIFDYAAGGFHDFTRIASSSSTMWADICEANKDEILESIEAFAGCLDGLRLMIDRQDKDALTHFFQQAKKVRDINFADK